MKPYAVALLFFPTCRGQALEQYTPDKADWSTFYSKAVLDHPKNTDHSPDGVFWIDREDWKEWDGTVYNATEYTKKELADLICPGHTVRGMYELFHKHKPFADNRNPTKAEVDNWHATALNHVRAMVGYTEEEYKIRPAKCLHLRALWSDERANSRIWDTDEYPGTCEGSTAPHCGAGFLPNKKDQQPYLPEGIDYCDKRAGSEGLFSAAKSNIPWSIKWIRPFCGTLAGEGFWGGHTMPWFGRSLFGWSWHDFDESNFNSNAGLRTKWSGPSGPSKYINPKRTDEQKQVNAEDVNPYPRFTGVDCEGIDWYGSANRVKSATECYERMMADDNCGKRFMTLNPLNFGCACYPPDMSKCEANSVGNRLTWDFSPLVSSFDGLFIDLEKKLTQNKLPYSGRECPQTIWLGKVGDPSHCLQKIMDGNYPECGRKFMTFNAGGNGCACYPPSQKTCTRSESNRASGRQTYELEVDPTYFTSSPTITPQPTSARTTESPTRVPSVSISDSTEFPSSLPSTTISSSPSSKQTTFVPSDNPTKSLSVVPTESPTPVSECAATIKENFCRRRTNTKRSLAIKMPSGGVGAPPSRNMKKPCTILVSVVLFEDERTETVFECEMSAEDGGQILLIQGILPNDIRGGVSTLFSNEAVISSEKLIIPDGVSIMTKNENNSLVKVTGNRNVLAIIVKAPDGSLKTTEEKLSNILFGTNGAEVSVKSQFGDCSYNELTITMAQNQGSQSPINGGVLTVELKENIMGLDSSEISYDVDDLAKDLWGLDTLKYDHVMYCLPKGTKYNGSSNWKGWGELPGRRTFYSGDAACNSLSLIMHELGHNLGLDHSTEDGNNYGDETGMMGRSKKKSDGPKKCFNAPKNWQLGWFTDRRAIAEPKENNWEGSVVGIAEYDISIPKQYVAIFIGSDQIGGSVDYYVSFNREKKGTCNEDTTEGANQVLVHSKSSSTVGGTSDLKAKLSAGESFEIPSQPTHAPIEIQVSNINTNTSPGIATVKINLEGAPTESPSLTQTSKPTNTVPTSRPSLKPTGTPIATENPSLNPTEAPSASSSPTLSVTDRLYEAEDVHQMQGCRTKSDKKGRDFVDMGGEGSWFEWNNINGGSQGGQCTFKFLYALGKNELRLCDVTINGDVVGSVGFDETPSFRDWEYKTLVAPCSPGINIVRVTALTEGGPNVDNVLVSISGGPSSLSPSHVPTDVSSEQPSNTSRNPSTSPSEKTMNPSVSFSEYPSKVPTGVSSEHPSNTSRNPSTSPSEKTMNPSVSFSEYPSKNPSNLVPATKCADLTKFVCKKKTEECVLITKPSKIGLCTIKKLKFEHSCSQYTKTKCTKKSKGLCTFTNGKCIHLCNVEEKTQCNQMKAKNKKPCKFKNVPNPCLGCHPVPVC